MSARARWPRDRGGSEARSARTPVLDVSAEVRAALDGERPVVALESTLLAHGLPWPVNLETARAAEAAVRDEGAVPATVAVWQGRPAVGLAAGQLEALARGEDVLKAGRRDLAAAIAHRKTAATTVAGTMALAHLAGIRVFATGGIGGVHRGTAGDVSADLAELAATPLAVVCAGAKNILDLPRTVEYLETSSVPVVGYRTDTFPAFYLRSSGLPVSCRADTPAEAAAVAAAHWALGGAGVVVAQPVAEEAALGPAEWEAALARAEAEAQDAGVRGPAVTPFLLARIALHTGGRSLSANQALVLANARLAARIAASL